MFSTHMNNNCMSHKSVNCVCVCGKEKDLKRVSRYQCKHLVTVPPNLNSLSAKPTAVETMDVSQYTFSQIFLVHCFFFSASSYTRPLNETRADGK